MFTVGIDPDSESHGVAIYKNGILISLHMWTLPRIVEFISNTDDKIIFAIEDVKHKKCVYRQKSSSNPRIQGEIGRCLGLNQQSQVELERMLEYMNISYLLYKPRKGNWADPNLKRQFEKATGWDSRSNKDTRSAAFFGYLALNRC